MSDNFIETDWVEFAGCAVDSPEDTRFIRRPTPEEEDEWGLVCAGCQVFEECLALAERLGSSGVFIAGEWRE